MSEVTPIPKPAHYEFVANGFIDHIFDWYSLAQLKAYGAAEYQRAIEDAAKLCDAQAMGWIASPSALPDAGFIAANNCGAFIRVLGSKK
jgi:hypothetical protein